MDGYVDVFLLPVPKNRLAEYAKMSTAYGKIMKKYGVLDYREFVGEDLKAKGMTAFPKRVNAKPGEVVVAAIIGYKSKTHRDQIRKKTHADPKIIKMMAEYAKNNFLDMKRMSYGGFKTIVNP